MSKSSPSRRKNKTTNHQTGKPYDGFPLTLHRATNRWCKKHRGTTHYFGPINADDPAEYEAGWNAALERYQREWPFILDGRTPPPVESGEVCTLQLLCNAFLTSKMNKLQSGELTPASFRIYNSTTDLLIEYFGPGRRVDDLRPDDFEDFRKRLAKRFGIVTLKNEINRCRVVFKFAFDQRLISQPINFGQSFNRPAAKLLRKARNEAGLRLFEADELRTILDALDGKKVTLAKADEESGRPKKVRLKADPVLRAMVLLGINCGFGNTDVATLPQTAVDFENGWCDFPRPKTEIRRRVPLWAETLDALRKAISQRPTPKNPADDDLCFLTVRGNRWVRSRPMQKSAGEQSGNDKVTKYSVNDEVAKRMMKLLKALGINGRKGIGFYTLRHTFETQAGESTDQVAVNSIMGHVDNSMAGVYRERISDERLKAVVEVVRAWLQPAKAPPKRKPTTKRKAASKGKPASKRKAAAQMA